ncbi:MAG: hypothetical protein A2144_00175 [Chloroflexi bacterium RBG_16_50_9]|nr:MAG: hypothetical protein A2144_00175 [Chloroflexi bacterium RBG_16_50_9]
MIRLEESAILKRKIRQDDVADLGKPTWALTREAIKAGRVDEALKFIEYGAFENQAMHEGVAAMLSDVLTHLATLGEGEVEKAWRLRYNDRIKKWLQETPGLMENLWLFIEFQRGLSANLTVTEEPDRYVIKSDPCGTGGRLKRTDRNVTRKAYPWSWGKSGILYYCTHCCIAYEQVPIELREYPLKVMLPPEKSGAPCFHLVYKKPELIPEEYFTRVGKKKTKK